jgi:quercetin dioxygenase-like cupin family protein
VEYTTQQGEEPPDHTHSTEDEIFYVLSGELTFRCGDATFDLGTGGFIYLPQGIEHGYTIHSEGPVRLIAIAFPTRAAAGIGWGGFVTDIESQGEQVSGPPPQQNPATES